MEDEPKPSQPLDAIISGWAYEFATTAIGVLEEGLNTKGSISSEMLCTLDNFVKVVLFNERIFVTGCVTLQNNNFIPRHAKYEGGKAGERLIEEAKIFFPFSPGKGGTSEEVAERINTILKPVNFLQTPLFVIQCKLPTKQQTIFQEMIYLDLYFIEFAIDEFGAHRFKPVFPGEHLYLGLRSQRFAIPQATHSIGDIPGKRLRAVVRERMEKLNAFVSQGAPLLPTLPPIFVTRLLHDCVNGSDFVQRLLEVRNSSALTRFRKWMVKCSNMSQTEDYAQREQAAAAIRKLDEFMPDENISPMDVGIGLLNIVKDSFAHDPLGIIADVARPLMTYLGGIPLAGLKQFGHKKSDPQNLDRFFKDIFGDSFNRVDRNSISSLLSLPEDLSEWRKETAEFSVLGGRLDNRAPPLGRPYLIQTNDPALTERAESQFNELLKHAEKVTPELIKKWEEENKQD